MDRSALSSRLVALAALAACDNAPPTHQGVNTGRIGAQVVPAPVAITTAEVATTDPQTMNAAEIGKVLGLGPMCGFAYTDGGDPVLALGPSPAGTAPVGVMKLHGFLVELRPAAADSFGELANGGILVAPGIRATVMPAPDEGGESEDGVRRFEATLRFELLQGQGLQVGYRGFYACSS